MSAQEPAARQLFDLPPTVGEPDGLAGPIPQPLLFDPCDQLTAWTDNDDQEG